MKKYLMMGAAALVFGFAAVSCSSDDVVYNPNAKSDLIEANYNKAFINVFGQPAANQTWGFGTAAKARTTRGECGTCWKKDMQYDYASFPKTGHPADITANEREYVKWWFENYPGLSEVGLDIHNFYLQHVWGQSNKPYNVIKKEDQSVEVNNATMDYCEVGDGTNYTHVLDFNANGPGSYGIVYMRNSSALSFGFHATWGDNRDYHNFKLAHIVADYKGEHIDGWYVGLAMWGEKWDNGTKQLNADYKDYADDWILKIVPGEGEVIPEEPSLRVMAEDLSASDNSDFDFNDVVFDVKRIDDESAEITLQAAGGTLPLCISREVMATIPSDYVPNSDICWEVHDEFQVDIDCMVNTKAPEKHLKGVDDKTPVSSLIVTGPKGTFPADQAGFTAAVKNIRVWVNKGTDEVPVWMELKAEVGKPACKIGVPVDLDWALERTNVNSAFNFDVWVQNPSTPLIPVQQ